MKQPCYFMFDTETGGLEPKHSLLEFYGITLTKDLEPVAEIHMLIRPNDGEDYIVNAGALAVNKIDLVSHSQNSITRNEASLKLFNFLKESHTQAGKKLIPAGHNIPFDIGMVFGQLMVKKMWETYCSYHFLDTCVLAEAFKIAGLIPPKVSRLGTIAEKLGVNVDANQLHGAKYDIMVNIEVLKKMISLLKKES